MQESEAMRASSDESGLRHLAERHVDDDRTSFKLSPIRITELETRHLRTWEKGMSYITAWNIQYLEIRPLHNYSVVYIIHTGKLTDNLRGTEG